MIKSCAAAAAAAFQHRVKGIQGRGQNETLCAWEKAGKTGRQIDIFRSWFYEPDSYISPI